MKGKLQTQYPHFMIKSCNISAKELTKTEDLVIKDRNDYNAAWQLIRAGLKSTLNICILCNTCNI